MSLTLEQLQKKVSNIFPDAEIVGDTAIRYTRRSGSNAFAVCYLDITNELPETPEQLNQFQDQLIGKNYFDTEKNLRWNNYLYFIVAKQKLLSSKEQNVRRFIELDRNYARKYIISEQEVSEILQPEIIANSLTVKNLDITQIWLKELSKIGIEDAIFNEASLPQRLKLIETAEHKGAKKVSVSKSPKVSEKKLPFIQTLELKSFRQFPSQKNYTFGKVNLFIGNNGAGKTSLLEALEIFYCGKNKRDQQSYPYEIDVHYTDNSKETASSKEAKAVIFRDRNLAWYGQSELRTNNLCQSFSKFNFMDTDAAANLAMLAEEDESLQDSLSKLLIGADASKVWRNMQRVQEHVQSKLREIQPRLKEAKSELTFLIKQLKQTTDVKQESESIFLRLKEMVSKLEWKIEGEDRDDFADEIIQLATEMVALLPQIQTLDWIAAPVSSEKLYEYCKSNQVVCKKGEASINLFEQHLNKCTELESSIKSSRQALKIIEKLQLQLDAEIPERMEKIGKLTSHVARLSTALAGTDAVFTALEEKQLISTLKISLDKISLEKNTIETNIKALKIEQKKFNELQKKSFNLLQELRQFAEQILETTKTPNHCPLCNHEFKDGELLERIRHDSTHRDVAASNALINKIKIQESELEKVTAAEKEIRWLSTFAKDMHLPEDFKVRDTILAVNEKQLELMQSRQNLDVLKEEVTQLEKQGFSSLVLEDLSDKLEQLNFMLPILSKEVVQQKLMALNTDLESQSQKLALNRGKLEETAKSLKDLFKNDINSLKDAQKALASMKNKYVKTHSILTKFKELSLPFKWDKDAPISAMLLELRAIQKIAAEMQAAARKEGEAKSVHKANLQRKKNWEEEIAVLQPRFDKLSKASSVLLEILENHSLDKALESSLEANRVSIESIFAKIHSPAEFEGLGDEWTTLVRKDGKAVGLNQISTGQRAALGLSIFLAQNAQLKSAPPVVLIDDPIAHIDDLNSLSFLDYLREIALTGTRQIFFATANDKLATLFERKFDFLGDDFQRFNLVRANA